MPRAYALLLPYWAYASLHVLSLALASTMLTLFYLEPLRKTNSRKRRTSLSVWLPVLLNVAVRVLSSSSFTGSPLNTPNDFKIANVTFPTLRSSQPAYVRLSLHACHSTRSLRLSNTNFLQWRIQDFCKGGAAAGAFGVPQAPSCPLSLRPLRKFRGS